MQIREAGAGEISSHQLEFLANRSDWPKLIGFNALASVYGLKELPTEDQISSGEDPHLLDSDTFLDKSQKAAIRSSLNMALPVVAVPGPPGSGKTTTLVKFLQLLAFQVLF